MSLLLSCCLDEMGAEPVDPVLGLLWNVRVDVEIEILVPEVVVPAVTGAAEVCEGAVATVGAAEDMADQASSLVSDFSLFPVCEADFCINAVAEACRGLLQPLEVYLRWIFLQFCCWGGGSFVVHMGSSFQR